MFIGNFRQYVIFLGCEYFSVVLCDILPYAIVNTVCRWIVRKGTSMTLEYRWNNNKKIIQKNEFHYAVSKTSAF